MTTTTAVADTLTEAASFAALKAIGDACYAEARDLAGQVLEWADALGVKTFTTPIGSVNIVRKAPAIHIDEEAFAATLPDDQCDIHVVRVPKETALEGVKARLKVVGGEVVDTATGEVVAWASARQTAPAVTYAATKQQRAAKTEAQRLVKGQVDALATAMTRAALEAA
jgi:hypothetical protein